MKKIVMIENSVVIQADCGNRKRLWWLEKIVMTEKDCNDWKFSSNIKKKIRTRTPNNYCVAIKKYWPSYK